MDTSKSTINQTESSTGASSSKSSMEHMNGASVGIRNANIPASLYLANEISPEAVMPDLNMFRPTTTALPLWNGTSAVAQGMNYSIISSPSTTANATINSSQPDSSMHAGHNGTIGSQPGSSSYDVFSGANHDEPNSFAHAAISPKNSFSESGNLSGQDSGSASDEQEDGDEAAGSTAPKRKKRTPVPDERKDAKYWARRRKNNDAAKRSRDMRRKKLDLELKNAREAIAENQKLKQEIDVLKAEINSLRRLLKDANTTLSLWIRARQAAEPNVQLPPMLRGSNVSFVNFPVSTAT